MSRADAAPDTPSTVAPDRLDALAARVPAGDDAGRLSVEAPFTGDPLGAVPACTPDDVRAAVARARDAADDWAARPVAERAAVLDRVHDRVLDAREELLDVLQAETGKSRADAFEEVLDVANVAGYYADVADSVLAPDRRTGVVPLLTRTTTRHLPAGVVGVITPWNYPLALSASDALPALAAGNAVVCKPDERAPYTSLLAAELLVDAGVPAGCLQVVTGSGPDLGEPLIEAVDHVAFTGSTPVGRRVAETAGRHLTPCTLELGGKNPMVVLADADVGAAARSAVEGAFANAGQLCVSIERIYVEDGAYEPFVDAFVAGTRRRRLGAAYDYGPDVGTLTTPEQLEKTAAHVDDAVERGATVETGGRARPDVAPYAYEPTVLTDVPPGALPATEETFGPVVAVYRVPDADTAVARANDTDYGLHASVWAGDAERGEAIAGRIRAGTVGVDDAYVAAWASVDAPMGGIGDSGIGRRHGPEGLTAYTETRTVARQRVGPLAPPEWLPGGAVEALATGALRVRRAVRRRL
jgi:succinate-semialdehyde dehydrogenase/glutarate-semialdehyde dehydrogenase